MIITKYNTVQITNRNVEHFKNLGYLCNKGENIEVLTDHLTKGSHFMIEVSCDVCGEKTKVMYKALYLMINKYGYFSCRGECSTKKVEESKLRIYGVTNNSKLESWKLEIKALWENRTDEEVETIINKRKNTNIEVYGSESAMQNFEVKEKRKKLFYDKYGVTNPSYIEEVKLKRVKTKLKRFGYINNSQSEEWFEKSKQTRIKNGYQVPDELKDPFIIYRQKVDMLTRNIKNVLFEDWDGYDYYDMEYIKDNLNLDPSDRLYPNVDHKISAFYGFMNDISPEDICKIDNLCITKKFINCSKAEKTEEEYLIYKKIN